MNDFYKIVNGLQDTKHKKVLSTIIKVEGSSYRKEGAMMLHLEDGTQLGLLSGGCLEHDLSKKAMDVIKDGNSRTIEYDMSGEDDLSWGQGSGCNGIITILLELVDTEFEKHFKLALEYLYKGKSVFLIKKLSKVGEREGYIFLTGSEQHFGNWNGILSSELEHIFSLRKKGFIYSDDRMKQYFVQVIEPKPRLIIFGAGPDVRPLVDFAAKVGFYTIVTDWRPAYCCEDYFPEVDELRVDFPKIFLENFTFLPNDLVVIMTHNFQKDREILNRVLKQDLLFLGILGPRKRTCRILGKEDIPQNLQSPLGLSIGAQGPCEIAISILAELINTVRKGEPHDNWNLFSGGKK